MQTFMQKIEHVTYIYMAYQFSYYLLLKILEWIFRTLIDIAWKEIIVVSRDLQFGFDIVVLATDVIWEIWILNYENLRSILGPQRLRNLNFKFYDNFGMMTKFEVMNRYTHVQTPV
jgi:hypothetical protein